MSDSNIAEQQVYRVETAIEDFLAGYEGSYAQTFEGTQKVFMNEGMRSGGSAYFVPAVRFVMKTSLDMLNNPRPDNEELPREVKDRASVAQRVSRRVAESASEQGIFEDAYRKAGIPLVHRGRYTVTRVNTIANLTDAAFMDASMLAGGAFKLLEDHDSVMNKTGAVQRSYGLLSMARVAQYSLSQVHERLGKPYVYTRNLQLDKGDLRVRFTPEILTMLNRHTDLRPESSRGCPAAKIKTNGFQGTVLQEDWRSIVGYLVPPDATVEGYRNSEPWG